MFTPEQAQGLATFLLKSIEGEFNTTKRVLAAVPEDRLDFKLGEKGRTAHELMWHIVGSELWFGDGIVKAQFLFEGDPPAPATRQDILDRFEEVHGWIAKVRAMSAEDLAKPVDFFGIMTMPNVTYLHFWLNHTIHHRGQLSAYVRAMNAHVPSIYGPSADEGMGAASA
ncbi:MAG: DinB family protein [Bryobacteraceae bacterium]